MNAASSAGSRAKWRGVLALIPMTLLLARPPLPRDKPSSDVVAITHVSVIPMDAERVLEDQTVVATREGISAVGPAADVAVPPAALQIDGRARFLMPGLADLHVHLFSADDLLPYVAWGVTTVQNMDGGPQHLKWRSEVRAGTLLGPTIFTAGHTIDGIPPLNELFLPAETPEAAQAIVSEQKRAGYDMIKVYGTLRPAVFRAILRAGDEAGIPVVGHINRQIGALEVLKSTQVLAAHLEDLLFARFDHPPTDTELDEFASAVAASHMTVTPNLNVNPANIAQTENLEGVLASADARLLSPAAYSQWMPANNRNERDSESHRRVEMMNGIQKTLYAFVGRLHARGVRLVAGTDAAAYGFPGVSLHQELEELVDAGFSPYEALLTATRNAGDFIAKSVSPASRFGAITPGSAADMVLLSANPLEHVKNARRIEGVFLKGRWLSAAELQEKETALFTRSEDVKRRLQEIDRLLEAGDEPRAEGRAAGLGSDGAAFIAEWVLMTKARKLQDKKLPLAIDVARLDTRLYPHSYSAFYLLADLLFRAGDRTGALVAANHSLTLEPHNSATDNLVRKLETVAERPRFTPAGTYAVEYANGVSGEVSKADIVIAAARGAGWTGTMKDGDGQTANLRSVLAGGSRLWAEASTPFGPIEFRIVVDGRSLSGEWAAPFGRNGTLRGVRVD